MLILTMIAVFAKELTNNDINLKQVCFADPNYSSDCQNIFLLELVLNKEPVKDGTFNDSDVPF